jgi:phage tail-like protein
MVAFIPPEEDPATLLAGFAFHVDARVEGMAGKPLICLGAFSEVSGLEATMEPKVIKEGGRNYGAVQRAGPVTFATVVLKRGVSLTRDLWSWWALFSGGDGAVTGGYAAKNRTDVVVSMINGRTAVLSWRLQNAMPIKFKTADLNARATEVAIEELHLAHEGLKVEA